MPFLMQLYIYQSFGLVQCTMDAPTEAGLIYSINSQLGLKRYYSSMQ